MSEDKKEARRRHGRTRQKRLDSAKAKGTHERKEWVRMVRFFGNHCVRCGKYDFMQKDHICPISKEGSHSITNIQPLCSRCNQMKGYWDIVDYRPSFCENHNLILPGEWEGDLEISS